MVKVKLFLLIFIAVSFLACGKDNPAGSEKDTTNPYPLYVKSMSITGKEKVDKIEPITVMFSEEMASVEIKVGNIKGITTLNGDKAVWIPMINNASPGSYLISITGTSKSGKNLTFVPVEFEVVSIPKLPDPWEAISKAMPVDLWFPGKNGSQWVYKTSSGGQEIFKLSDKIEKNGKTYQLVSVSDVSNKLLSDGTSSPFTIFRVDGDRILGFAESDNKKVEKSLEQELRDALARDDLHDQLGLKEGDIANVQTKHESMDDWVIIDKANLKKGGTWCVARTYMSAWMGEQKILERIQAKTARVVDVSYFNNESLHDLPVVSIEYYVVDEDQEGNVRNSYFLDRMSVSPGVGMVLFVGTQGSREELVGYNVVK
jgi:hypothetical protein